MESAATTRPPDPPVDRARAQPPALRDADRRRPSAARTQQLTRNPDPVAMDTPTDTPHDLFCLAKEYERRGRLPDAANLYLKAAMNGHLSAMVSYATHLVQSDERTAFVWFRAAAERGDARAWSELGQLLARGRYFEVDAIDAARCWKRAAQMGDNSGKSSLGLCYIRGFGVRQDADKGVEIVRQVADVHGDVPAMKNLAWIYRYGKGVPKNLQEAEYWDNRANKQEKVMAHIASREHALFGRGRHSRSSRHKPTREYDTREPVRDPARGDATQERDRSARSDRAADRAALVRLEEHARRSRDRDAKSKALVGADLETRLRQVSEEPSRRTQKHYVPKALPAVSAADDAYLPTQHAQSELSDEPHQSDDAPQIIEDTDPQYSEQLEPEPVDEQHHPFNASAQRAEQHPTEEVHEETSTQFWTDGGAGAVEARRPEQGLSVENEADEAQARFEEREEIEEDAEQNSRVEVEEDAVSSEKRFEGDGTSDVIQSGNPVPSSGREAQAAELEGQAVLAGLALEEFKANSEAPKPELGEAINELKFTPAGNAETYSSSRQAPLGPSLSEVQAVQDRSSPKASEQQQLFSGQSQIPQPQPTSPVQPIPQRESRSSFRSADEPTEEPTDENFLTPEQSLAEEDSGLSPYTNSAVVGGSAVVFGKVVSNEVVRSSNPDQGSTDILGTATASDFQAGADDEGATGTVESPEPVLNKEGNSAPGTILEAADSRSLGSEVRARSAMFDGTGASTAAKLEEEQASLRRGMSYKLTKTAEFPLGEDLEQSLDEFEQADLQKVSSAQVLPTPHNPQRTIYTAADQTVSCTITRASSFTREGIPGVRRTVPVGSDGGFGNEEPTIANLQETLAQYPTNPLRSDSQVPLFNLLNVIHRFPLTNAEAFRTLDNANGFSKIVVAMLAQSDDEFLQDVGLHAFVRVVRATPSAQREALVLSSYADCYRNAQGNIDAVIPKGPLGIDESASGAIQGVVQAMRFHESVRRVQLAGCAALSEIASISPSCRSQAYEYGAISLIISCLRHRSSKAACMVHDQASVAVGSFCSGKENFVFKEAFTNAGAVPELLKVLQLWGHAENDSSELLTTATKSCCCALRHITDGCSVASAQCVQSFAYHHLVRVMVLCRDDVGMCTLVVSALTSITRNAGSIAEKGLMDAKPLPEVLNAMQTHSAQPLFVRKALDFMESLGNFNSMKEEIVMAGGIPFAADIIQQGGNDALLLERACGVVEKLCRTNEKNQETFASHNGVQSLTTLLDTHNSLPGVAERALLALTSACANNQKNQREAIKVGTCDQVVKALATFSTKNAKVVAAATNAMSALVVPKNAPVTQSFAQLKAPELVVRAMKRHPDNVMVQENGSAAVASFCEADPRITAMLLKSGISSVLVVALQRYLHKQGAVLQIVRAMRAISNEASEDSYRFKTKLLTDRSNESSLSEIFHTALSHHKKSLPETGNVIISICATINRLCMRSVGFKNEIGKDGIVEELKLLVEKTAEFKELGALQPVLATICTLVLDSEENKNRFHAAGGVEAILNVMQQWKSDTYVLEHCCAALRYSCNDHFGNCDEVKNHNGVRSILGVMELHPENVNVSLWCCLTLADLCKGDEALQSSPNVVQGIRKAVSAMSLFSSNSRFLASACEFLRAASVDNPENQERIVRLGGRTAMVKAMEAHPGDNNLTESAAYALLQIQDVQDPRDSVDSQAQEGLVKRISRDLRRSGSGSHRSRSDRSGRAGFSGLLGRKSRSFSKRRPADNADEEIVLSQTVAEENPTSRPTLMSFARNGKSRSRRRGRSARPVEDEEEDLTASAPAGHEPFREGAEDGYGDFDAQQVTSENGSDPQID